jgi:DMSO/TMAO reductase YedYZ molybdopterin-dependent catalytic subunit
LPFAINPQAALQDRARAAAYYFRASDSFLSVPSSTLSTEQQRTPANTSGELPVSALAQFSSARCQKDGFKDYKLKIGGLVENPADLSLQELRALGDQETVTMHHCIQGWSGIAQWRGILMRRLIEHVKPQAGARAIAFYSFGPALFGGGYYETQDLYNAMKAECLLALEMNGQPLPAVYGAPLRMRVEKSGVL